MLTKKTPKHGTCSTYLPGVFISDSEQAKGPILEFKGSVRHAQKGHHSLVAQVDLILDESISDNWMKEVIQFPHTFMAYYSFYRFLFPL